MEEETVFNTKNLFNSKLDLNLLKKLVRVLYLERSFVWR
jgi:hypothetical protein